MGTKVRCLKCKDIIESKQRHDFVRCRCGALFVDGGDDYLRMGGSLNYEFVQEVESDNKDHSS